MSAFGIFAEDVEFNLKGGAGGEGAEARSRVGVGDNGDFYYAVDDGGDGEADAFNGDGALRNNVPREGFRELDAEAPIGLRLAGNDRG